jgi:hypothetical protein
LVGIDEEIGAGQVAAAWSRFRVALAKARGVRVDERPDDLAVAAASNDVAAIGGLLGPRDVNWIRFEENDLPESLVVARRDSFRG